MGERETNGRSCRAEEGLDYRLKCSTAKSRVRPMILVGTGWAKPTIKISRIVVQPQNRGLYITRVNDRGKSSAGGRGYPP